MKVVIANPWKLVLLKVEVLICVKIIGLVQISNKKVQGDSFEFMAPYHEAIKTQAMLRDPIPLLEADLKQINATAPPKRAATSSSTAAGAPAAGAPAAAVPALVLEEGGASRGASAVAAQFAADAAALNG